MRSQAMRMALAVVVLCLTTLLALAQTTPGGNHCIQGIVFEDVDNDGAFDPEFDVCLQGVQVSLSTGATAINDCNDFGGYFFGELAAGTYTVSVSPIGYTSNSRTVSVGGDSFPCGNADLPVRRTGSITGRIFEDVNGNGSRDDGEPCVTGVVALIETEQTSNNNCLDESGYFFGSLAPGTYTLRVQSTVPAIYTTPSFTVTIPAFDDGPIYHLTRHLPVRRNLPPSITCPDNITQNNDEGQCGADVNYPAPTVTGGTPPYSVTCEPPPGSFFGVGVTTVTCTVVDAAQQSASCTFTVTVRDTEKPVITCPANITRGNDPGQCSAVINPGQATATDNCDEAIIPAGSRSDDRPLADPYPVGTTTITWTATDEIGNQASCQQTVTVNDTERPIITCPPNVSRPADPGQCQAVANPGQATATDNCPVVTVTSSRNDERALTAPYPVGTTTITWTATDAAGNSITCAQSVTIIDAERPTISCPANVTVNTDPGQCTASGVALGQPTASDNCGPVTVSNNAPATFPRGATTVTWTASDAAGNTATCTQTVTVNDVQNPTIVCPSNVTVSTDEGQCSASDVSLGTPTTSDNCGVASVSNNAPATFPKGTTTVIWTVTDTSGNTATCSQTVTVNDTEAPAITCPANITRSNDPGQCSAVIQPGQATATDNCPGVTVGFSRSDEAQTLSAPFRVGTTTISWTATDAVGNQTTCRQTVTVTDTERPTITCPANIVQSTEPGRCGAVVNYPTPAVADNCPGVTLTCTPASGSTFPAGITTVTCTATDTAGNQTSCTFTVTITGAISGRILDSISGQCVEGTVLLQAADEGGNPIGEGTTAPANCPAGYRFANLLPGIYRLSVTGTTIGCYDAPIRIVTIPTGESCDVRDRDLLVNRLGSISGRVIDSGTGGCVRSVVSLRRVGETSGPVQTQTLDCDETTRYSFANLLPGTYELRVESTDPECFDRPSVTVTIPTNEQCAVERDLPVTRLPQSISGVVALDANGNRVRDFGEPALPGATVELLNAAGSVVAGTSTGAGGEFSFLVQTPGSYSVVVRSAAGQVITAAFGGGSGHTTVEGTQVRVGLERCQGATGLLFLVQSRVGPGISGRAFSDSNGDCEPDAGDGPASLTVRLLDTAGGEVAVTSTLEDGSYFFASPAAGRSYVITTAPAARAFPGPNAEPAGDTAILIRNLQANTEYRDNHFLTSGRSGLQGAATVEGSVLLSPQGQPLAGVTVLLRDVAGVIRDSTSTGADGRFYFRNLPIASYRIQKVSLPGFAGVDARAGQNGTRLGVNELRVDMVRDVQYYAGFQFFDQRDASSTGAGITIRGTVRADEDGAIRPLPGVVLILRQVLPEIAGAEPCVPSDSGVAARSRIGISRRTARIAQAAQPGAGRVIGSMLSGANGEYAFTNLPPGIYQVEAINPPGTLGSDALPGPNARRINADTIEVATVEGVVDYPQNDFIKILQVSVIVQEGPGVGTPVLANNRLAHFRGDPRGPDTDFTELQRLEEDGTLTLLDYFGTALLRFPDVPGIRAEILLDTTRLELPDDVGLARLLEAITSQNGVTALLVLRADNTRGFYRLANGRLDLLAVLPEARGETELAIGDQGQIAYVAPITPTVDSPLALFQAVGGPGGALLRQGQVIANGPTIESFSDLTSNGAGDLALLVTLRLPDGAQAKAVVRRRGGTFEILAITGQTTVPRDNQGTGSGLVTELLEPRIGPDGTVVFLGAGEGFVNIYLARPGQPLQAALEGSGWNPDPATFDVEIAANGAIALRAALGDSLETALYLIAPAGGVTQVVAGRRDIQPIGRPVFGPSGTESLFFFLAANLEQPVDRNGQPPVGLYRARLVGGQLTLEPVAEPGQPVPGRPGSRLLRVTQRPAISSTELVFGTLFGGPESLPVPTAALFRVPLNGTLADGDPVALEGAPIADPSRIAILQELSFDQDATLVFNGLLPGAGPLIAPVPALGPTGGPAFRRTGPSARTSARLNALSVLQQSPIAPLLATGDNLGTGQLEALLPPLLALAPDRELFVARISQTNGLDREGLFTVNRNKQAEQVAVSRSPAVLPAGPLFNGFADTRLHILSAPSVSADGNVVFKALLDRGGGNPRQYGVFQWPRAGTAPTLVRLADDSRELERWAAGSAGAVYLQVRTLGGTARLMSGSGGALTDLVVPGVTPIRGGGATTLTDLREFVLDAAGSVYVSGVTASGVGIFRFDRGQNDLVPVVTQRSPVRPLSDGRGQNLFFGSAFELMPDSVRGDLIFRARVADRNGRDTGARGEFIVRQGVVVTQAIEGVGIEGARAVSVARLPTLPFLQSRNGTTVNAYQTGSGKWVISRSRRNPNGTSVTTVVIAQEGTALPGVPSFAALDAGPLLEQEELLRRDGPVLALNDAGDVAFLASDKKRWGIYQVPASR